MKNTAFVSWANLATSESTFLYEFPGKLAALWYDEMILQVPTDTLNNVKEIFAVKEKWNDNTLKEFNKIHIPITKHNTGEPFIQPSVNHKFIKLGVQIGKIYHKEKYPKEVYNENNSNHVYSVTRTGNTITSSFQTWKELNKKINCTYLPNYYEGLFLEAIQQKEQRNTSELLSIALPDLNDYSWDHIMELRNHPFFNDFRNKVSLVNESVKMGDIKLSKELFEELKNKDLIEMIEIMRPSTNTKIIKGIASNLPSPFLINPLSVYTALEDIKRDVDVQNNYGWIYFLLDTRK